jgi:hypothetical protein
LTSETGDSSAFKQFSVPNDGPAYINEQLSVPHGNPASTIEQLSTQMMALHISSSFLS